MLKIQKRNILSGNPVTDILVSPSCKCMIPDKRFSLIGGDDNIFIIRYDPDQI